MNFASDNWAGASEKVLGALVSEARQFGEPYAGGPAVHASGQRLSDLFECEVAAFLVGTGTAANALALSAFARPGGVVFAHRASHAASEECGAPEFFGAGLKMVGLGGERGKIAAADLGDAISEHANAAIKRGRPAAVSISQITELGAVYRPNEIAELAEVARSGRIALHMDGARFANALVALGCAPADITWRAGVDVLSFGGTKNGCVGVEAVIFFDPGSAAEFPFIRKRAGHLLSKARLSAAQLTAYLADDHWLDLAANANAMAKRLARGLAHKPGVRLPEAPEANEIFPIFKTEVADRLRKAGAKFSDWPIWALDAGRKPGPGETTVRLVASFATTADDVDRFLDLL
ncbi:MAG: low specificity L-threonine aldolase [Bauldia sp.]